MPPPSQAGASGVWRYRAQIRLPADWSPISLGEGRAPWLRLRGGPWVACAHHEPTLSFKARGAAVLATWAREAGKEPLIEDSSGNAGAALATYAAAAGMRSRIYVPASAAGGKRRLLEAVGAEVVAVPGPRPETTRAALEDTEGTYCSPHLEPALSGGHQDAGLRLVGKADGSHSASTYRPGKVPWCSGCVRGSMSFAGDCRRFRDRRSSPCNTTWLRPSTGNGWREVMSRCRALRTVTSQCRASRTTSRCRALRVTRKRRPR